MAEENIGQKSEYFLRLLQVTYRGKATKCRICKKCIRSGDEIFGIFKVTNDKMDKNCLNFLCTKECVSKFEKKISTPIKRL